MKSNWQYNPLTGVETMSTPKHTPLKAIGSYFDNANGKTIGKIIEYKGSSLKDDAVKISEANALCSHIVKCVNLHDSLIEELQRIVDLELLDSENLYVIEELLKRAKGEV